MVNMLPAIPVRPPTPPSPPPLPRPPREEPPKKPTRGVELLKSMGASVIAYSSVEQARQAVLAEAESWLDTPYHHQGRVKGAGVDCLTFLAEVYERVGIIPHIEVEYYPPDWHIHRGEERYLNGLMQHAKEIEGPPLPADIVIFKMGRVYSHGAIVVEWPKIIHSYVERRCVWWGNGSQGDFNGRPHKFFRPLKFA